MEQLGLSERNNKILLTVTKDIIKSCEIEGHVLHHEQVRSSVSRRLGCWICCCGRGRVTGWWASGHSVVVASLLPA